MDQSRVALGDRIHSFRVEGNMMENTNDMQETLVTLTADIAAEYLGNNNVAVSDIELVIQNIYRGLSMVDTTVILAGAIPAAALPSNARRVISMSFSP